MPKTEYAAGVFGFEDCCQSLSAELKFTRVLLARVRNNESWIVGELQLEKACFEDAVKTGDTDAAQKSIDAMQQLAGKLREAHSIISDVISKDLEITSRCARCKFRHLGTSLN